MYKWDFGLKRKIEAYFLKEEQNGQRTNKELLTTFLIKEATMDHGSWVGPSPVAVPVYRQETAREAY